MVTIFLFALLWPLALMPTSKDTQSSIVKKLTMDDAVQRALTHRPDLEALRYATQAWESAAKSERAGYFPTIDLASNISQSNGESEIDSDTDITVKQQIYSFAGPLQKYQRAKKIAQVSELDKVIETNKTRLETEKTFLSAWLIQEKKKSITALDKASQSTFERQKHRNELEKLDKDEWIKNVADYASSVAQVDQYKDDVIIAYKKLEFLMGESLSLLSTPNEDPEVEQSLSKTRLIWNYKKKYKPEPLDTYYHYAITSRPEVPQGLKKMEIEKWNIRLAQGARLPEINASANVGCLTNPNDAFVLVPTTSPEVEMNTRQRAIRPYWELSVSLNWSIFDGLVTQYREQQAEADKVKEMLRHEQVILDVKQQVHERYYSLVKTLKQLRAQKLKYIHGNNHFKLMKQQLDLGKIAQVDFDAATSDWKTVQFNWLTYNVDLALAEHELMWACGYPEMNKD